MSRNESLYRHRRHRNDSGNDAVVGCGWASRSVQRRRGDRYPQIVEFKPDILLTDLVMAELDGLELGHELRENKGLRAMNIAFVSAKTYEFWRDRASKASAMGYIVKPLDTDTFVETVEAFAVQ